MNHFAKKALIASAVIAISLIFLNCATIVRGTNQTIFINSNVNGAIIEMNGTVLGKTPTSIKVKKGKDIVLKIRKKGYLTQSINLEKEVDGLAGIAGNFVWGGTTGTTTDWATGALYMYDPETYYANLQKEGESAWDYSEELSIRKFGMINHSQIAIDAGNNQGEYVDALADLMKSKKSKDVAVQNIKTALENSKGDKVVFGDELIESFRN